MFSRGILDIFCLLQATLNKFMSLGHAAWHETRQTLQSILSKDQGVLRDDAELQSKCLIPQNEVTMHLPANIGTLFKKYIIHKYLHTA